MKKEENIFLEIKSRYTQVVWTHKVNEKQADIYKKKSKVLNIILIILDAITTGGILKLLNDDLLVWKIVIAISSTFVLILNSMKTFYNLDELSNTYKNYANKFLNIRNELKWMMALYKSGKISTEDLINKFEKTSKDLAELYKDAPSTTDEAVKKASKDLNEDDDFVSLEEKEKTTLEHARKGNKC